jgi:hypothetical protein
MPKSKTQQYISRRQAGMSKEEAQKRSYLKQSGAWKAERAYVQTVVDAECARMAREAAESALKAAEEAEEAALKADRDRRKRLQPAPEARGPRCRLCGSDHCHCSDPGPATVFEPVSDYGYIDPIADPRFAATVGDAGLPYDFLIGLAENNPGERVERGIWSPEKGFISEGDQAEADFNAQQDAVRQRNRDMDKCAGAGPMRTR